MNITFFKTTTYGANTRVKDSFVLFRISLVRLQYSHIVAPIKKKNFKYDLTVKGGKKVRASFCVSVEVKETKHFVTLSIATVKPLC